jgi:hypothetical protein
MGKNEQYKDSFKQKMHELADLPVNVFDNIIKPIPIHNLDEENIKLDLNTHKTLAYGLKFSPQPRKFPSNEVTLINFKEFQHAMMNKYSAYVEDWSSKKGNKYGLRLKLKTKVKVKSVQPRHGIIMNFCADVLDDITSELDKHREANPDTEEEGYKNMRKQESKTLHKLKNANKGIIKPSDKNMGPSICTSKTYKKGGWQHLSDTRTYTQLEEEEKLDFCKKAVQTLTDILRRHKPDRETSEFLTAFIENFNIPNFYLIWKIHKFLKRQADQLWQHANG